MVRWRMVALLALLGCLPQAQAEPYVCPDGRFSAELSTAVTRTTSQSESPLGPITTNVLLDRQEGRFLTVSYTDLPRLALLAGREHIFNEAKEGMLAQCNGKEISWTTVDRQTRRLTYQVSENPGYRGETLFRLDQFRLYVVDVRSLASLKKAPDDQFLASFRILTP